MGRQGARDCRRASPSRSRRIVVAGFRHGAPLAGVWAGSCPKEAERLPSPPQPSSLPPTQELPPPRAASRPSASLVACSLRHPWLEAVVGQGPAHEAPRVMETLMEGVAGVEEGELLKGRNLNFQA